MFLRGRLFSTGQRLEELYSAILITSSNFIATPIDRKTLFEKFWSDSFQIRYHLIFYVDCKVDWCPPPDFTSEIVPIVYRNLDDDEKVTFENGAKVDSGKVLISFLTKICSRTNY